MRWLVDVRSPGCAWPRVTSKALRYFNGARPCREPSGRHPGRWRLPDGRGDRALGPGGGRRAGHRQDHAVVARGRAGTGNAGSGCCRRVQRPQSRYWPMPRWPICSAGSTSPCGRNRRADSVRAAGRRARRFGDAQSRRRSRTVHLPKDGGGQPLPHLPQLDIHSRAELGRHTGQT
jgi:hypothetical protein